MTSISLRFHLYPALVNFNPTTSCVRLPTQTRPREEGVTMDDLCRPALPVSMAEQEVDVDPNKPPTSAEEYLRRVRYCLTVLK